MKIRKYFTSMRELQGNLRVLQEFPRSVMTIRKYFTIPKNLQGNLGVL